MPDTNTTTPEVSDEIINELADKLKDETSDWEVYRNEEYGFEFKYPNGWKLDSYRLSPWVIENYAIGSDNAPVHFGVYSEDKEIFLNSENIFDYGNIKYQINNSERNNPDSVFEGFNKYDLIDYGRYEGTSAGNVVIYSKNILDDNMYFVFEWQERPGNQTIEENNSDDLKNIVSTFKFIESK